MGNNPMPRLPPAMAQPINQSIPSSPIKLENRAVNGENQPLPEISSTTNNNGHAQQQQQVPTPTSTTFNTQEMFPLDTVNPAHTGSPGFLRGRGRGRPKLIGDELDAELVEYMVQVIIFDFAKITQNSRSNNRIHEAI